MEYKAKIFRHETFGSLRVVLIDGDPWFSGKDVAAALGYKNPREAVRMHVDPRDKREEMIRTPGGVQKFVLINKSGVYSLILDSQLPKAKEYRHWVTSEVLPQVDETGSYSPVAPVVATPAPVVEEPLDMYRIYLILLSDGTVKIGFSKRFCARIGEVKREINRRRKAEGKEELTFKDVYFTPKMTCEDARLVEFCFKEIFSEEHIEDEIFSVAFKTARAKIKYLVKLSVAALPNQSVNLIADKQD